MTTLLNKAGKQLFAKHLEQYAPQDPLYEFYTNDKGKQKRRKRALPPGLSKRDARILKTLMSRAHYLDKGFSFCGMRFGWTFLIGMVPVVGDVADISLNYLLIIKPSQQLELPGWLLRRMLMNNAVSAGVGFIPIAGDVFLGMFKANSRNVALLEEFLRIRGEEFIKMGGVPEPEESKGWFGSKKGKKSAPAAAAGVHPNDVEQVKPGAGMSGPEMKESLPLGDAHAPSTSKMGTGKSQKPGTLAVPPSTNNTMKDVPSTSRSGSSGFSFFGSRSKKNKSASEALPPPTRGDKGRFVEDVDFMPGAPPK